MVASKTPEKAAALALVKGNGTAVRDAFARSRAPKKVVAALARRALNDRSHPYIGKALVAVHDLILAQKFDEGVKDLLPAMAIGAVSARHESGTDVDAMIAKLKPLVAKSRFEAGLIAGHAMGLAEDGEFAQAIDLMEIAIACPQAGTELFVVALWVIQEDNSAIPVDKDRAKRFLAACLPHAIKDPRIHHNAACVYAELEDATRVVQQIRALKAAGYDKLAAVKKDCLKLYPALKKHAAFATAF